jgi:hypothetical protein
MVKKDEVLEERKVVAFESMAKSFSRIAEAMEERNDYTQDIGLVEWSDRLEWYMNEFFQIFKTKTVGRTSRPSRDAERTESDE